MGGAGCGARGRGSQPCTRAASGTVWWPLRAARQELADWAGQRVRQKSAARRPIKRRGGAPRGERASVIRAPAPRADASRSLSAGRGSLLDAPVGAPPPLARRGARGPRDGAGNDGEPGAVQTIRAAERWLAKCWRNCRLANCRFGACRPAGRWLAPKWSQGQRSGASGVSAQTSPAHRRSGVPVSPPRVAPKGRPQAGGVFRSP